MVRIGIGVVVLALIGYVAFRWYQQERAEIDHQSVEISQMNDQVGKLRSENERLKAELARVQEEEGKLATANQMLRKALEEAKLTGKVPALPFPPK